MRTDQINVGAFSPNVNERKNDQRTLKCSNIRTLTDNDNINNNSTHSTNLTQCHCTKLVIHRATSSMGYTQTHSRENLNDIAAHNFFLSLSLSLLSSSSLYEIKLKSSICKISNSLDAIQAISTSLLF